MSTTTTTPDRPRATLGVGWLVAAFALQLALTIWLAHLAACAHPEHMIGRISSAGGDHPSYFGAMEHYIAEGRYYFINMNGDEVVAGRMPHYALPYFILRQFLDVPAASDVFVVLQVMLMSVAIWLLARLMTEATNSVLWGALFLFSSIGCAHLTPYLIALLPDGPGIALLAIALYAFLRMEHRNIRRDGILLACSLCVLVVLKPYFALLYPLIALRWLLLREGIVPFMRRCALLSVPLLLLLVPWWLRNTQYFDRFFPFQQDLYAGYGYDEVELRKRELLVTLGEDASTWWEPGSMACLLHPAPRIPCTYQWPGHCSKEFRDRFEVLRTHYVDYLTSGDTTRTPALLTELAAAEQQYSNEHPWRAGGLNRSLLVRRFVSNSGSYHLPVHASNPCYAPSQLLVKGLASASYLASLVGLLLALAFMLVGRFRAYWPWTVPALYILVLFPLVLGAVEWRIFAAAYLFDLWLLFLLVGTAAQFMSTRVFQRTLSSSSASASPASSTTGS